LNPALLIAEKWRKPLYFNQGFGAGAGAKEQSIFLGAGATFKIQAEQELEPEPDICRTAPAPKLFLR